MIPLGIAPIGWTNDDMPELGGDISFEQCISEMALCGYSGCEVGNKFPKDKALLKHYLDLRRLKICNKWVSYHLSTQDFSAVKATFLEEAAFLHYFGASVIGGAECGNSIHGQYHTPITQRAPASAEDWRRLTSGLNELGRIALEEFGLKLAYHHHMGTMVQSHTETDRLLNDTDERYVFLNYDCGHFYFAGADPEQMLKKYFSRIAHIHLKDVRQAVKIRAYEENLSFMQAVKSGIYTVPGDGDLDIAALIRHIRQKNYQGWIVVEAEQDPALANPFEYAQKGYRFLRRHLQSDSIKIH